MAKTNLDFMDIKEKSPKRGFIELRPDFQMVRTKQLMIRGGDFYAIWLEDQQRWSKSY